MKKEFLMLMFFSFTIGISAQNITEATASEKKSALVNVEGLQSKLLLNVKQKEKMLEIVTLYEMGKHAIYKSNSDMDSKNKELETLELAHHKNIEEVLNEKQFNKYSEAIVSSKNGS